MICTQCFENKPIIRFERKLSFNNKTLCLDCLVNYLDNLKDSENNILIPNIKK